MDDLTPDVATSSPNMWHFGSQKIMAEDLVDQHLPKKMTRFSGKGEILKTFRGQNDSPQLFGVPSGYVKIAIENGYL